MDDTAGRIGRLEQRLERVRATRAGIQQRIHRWLALGSDPQSAMLQRLSVVELAVDEVDILDELDSLRAEAAHPMDRLNHA